VTVQGRHGAAAAPGGDGLLRSFSFRDLDLRRKILVVALLPTALLVVAFLAVFATQRGRVTGMVESGMGGLAQESLARAARDLRTLCEATHQELWNQVPRSLRVMRDQQERLGPLGFSQETVAWSAVNQLDRSVTKLVLPRLTLGDAWIGQNADPAKPSPLVDRVKDLVGAEATLFQRMNERGDMLRVATTVLDQRSGGRAIGTYIPAVDPDGNPNPVVSTVLRGEMYRGRARVVDHWHLSGYEPIRDAGGRVVGMLFVGLRQDALEGIRHGVAASRIGATGSMYVLGGTGNQRGRYLIPPRGVADGADGWETRDARGEPYVQRLVESAIAAGGRPAEVRLRRPVDDRGARERVAAAAYFAPWDWVIVAELDREEAVAPLREVQTSLAGAFAVVALLGFALLVATIWAANRGARRLTAPLEAMALAAERIAQGDVRQEVTYRSRDEIGRLAEAFRGTVRYIQEVARGGAAIAGGDLSTELVPRSERDELTQSFQSAQTELRRVVEEMERLANAAVEGRLSERAAPERFQGAYRAALEGVNATLSTLVGHLDVMPAPAMIIGPDFTIRYMNQTGATLLGKTQAELIGTRCYDGYRMGDCRTACCASARAMAEDREVSSETDAHPEGLDLDVLYTAVPLRDPSGKVIGAFEVVTDQVAVKRVPGTEPTPRPCALSGGAEGSRRAR
jgi:HAMP domain-containing protein